LLGGDLSFVGQIEPQLFSSDERSLLIDLITKDFPEGIVKNMSSSVIIAYRPST